LEAVELPSRWHVTWNISATSHAKQRRVEADQHTPAQTPDPGPGTGAWRFGLPVAVHPRAKCVRCQGAVSHRVRSLCRQNSRNTTHHLHLTARHLATHAPIPTSLYSRSHPRRELAQHPQACAHPPALFPVCARSRPAVPRPSQPSMDFNSLKDTVANLSLYDLKAGVRKVQNGNPPVSRCPLPGPLAQLLTLSRPPAVMNYTEMESKVHIHIHTSTAPSPRDGTIALLLLCLPQPADCRARSARPPTMSRGAPPLL